MTQNELKVGMKARIMGYIRKEKPSYSSSTELVRKECREPREVLILGKSKRVTGRMLNSNWDDPGEFIPDKSHDVWIVMELDKNNRFRTPLAVFEDQILLEGRGYGE